MFTLFSGWAFRARWLPNGSRQILNILLPGDLIGVEEYLLNSVRHAVYSLTDVTYCRFDAAQIPTLFKQQPGLGRKLIWQIAEQTRELETRMASIGRQIADRSLATFLLGLHARLMQRGMAGPHSYGLPLTQAQIADALGLTIVHVNRVLRRLQREGIVTVQNRQVMIHDLPAFRELAGAVPDPGHPYLFL
jgi:CRP-like cAMP-binding protein